MLRNVHVSAEQRPLDVLVRITTPPGEDPEILMDNAQVIADALMRETRVAVGPSQQTRPAPGRQVRIARTTNGVEMWFASNSLLGLGGLRKRINDRVLRWQRGECPSLDQWLDRTQVAQAPPRKPPRKRSSKCNEP